MQDAPPAVRAFLPEGQPRSLAVEFGAPLDQLLDLSRPLLDERAHRRRVAKAVARRQRVPLVQRDLVVLAQGHRNPALRVLGRGFPQTVLGHYEDPARRRQFDGRAQAGDASANHQEIRFHSFQYPTFGVMRP